MIIAGFDAATHRVEHYRADLECHREALAARLARGEVRECCDAIEAQLAELVRSREPGGKLGDDDVAQRIAALLDGRSSAEYGVWVLYPWAGRVVHVLPQRELFELRTDRNRHKIDAAEQERLGGLRIGVVGLSVGQSIALALAQEGIGRHFHLADFDRLSLSNLNRVGGGVHEIGCPKVVMAARRILEIDPYATVNVFPRGFDDVSAAAFLDGLDVVVEECDSIDAKVLVRTEARRRRIPVVMVNSEGGVLDIERFDRESARPVFHGLVGDVDPERLRAMEMDEKVAFLLPVVGPGNLSDRMVASLVEIDSTISTWPQLASGVLLGAALVSHAVRELALDRLRVSGRWTVALDRLVADGTASHRDGAPPPPSEAAVTGDADLPSPATLLALASDAGDDLPPAHARIMLAHAVRAPSGGNAQPWQFLVRERAIEVRVADTVPPPVFDPPGWAHVIAAGAATENLVMAARALGWRPQVGPWKAGAHVDLTRAEPELDPLLRHVGRRCTNREHTTATAIPEPVLASLRESVRDPEARLVFLTDRAAIDELACIVGVADRLRMWDPAMLDDLRRELRWDAAEVLRTRDGIDVRSLGLRRGEETMLRLLMRPGIMPIVRAVGRGDRLESPARDRVRRAAAVGLLTHRGRGATPYFDGGRALQRLWLTATAHDLALCPMTTALFLIRLLDTDPSRLGEARPAVDALARRFARIFPSETDAEHILLFRLGITGNPPHRSLRRRLDDVQRNVA
jgi:molybdopterin/thiamine biosynthesis adenylyltransferase/nitroreductase